MSRPPLRLESVVVFTGAAPGSVVVPLLRGECLVDIVGGHVTDWLVKLELARVAGVHEGDHGLDGRAAGL
ncbi:MAG: hypothetical protein ACK5KO_12095 [Arachnia sp.]